MGENGTLRARRPSLADAISRLDEMIDGLATAIPSAVADSVRESLGAAFVAAVREAVKDALKDTMKDVVREAVKEANGELAEKATVAAPPTPAVAEIPAAPPSAPKPSAWTRVKAVLGRARQWAGKKVAPVVAHVAAGWAVARLVGSSTIHSWRASLTALVVGLLAGFVGYAVDPVTAAVLFGLLASGVAATAVWAGPVVGLLIAIRGDGRG